MGLISKLSASMARANRAKKTNSAFGFGVAPQFMGEASNRATLQQMTDALRGQKVTRRRFGFYNN